MQYFSRTVLEDKTIEYWGDTRRSLDSYQKYARNLLPLELAYAAQNPTAEGFPRLQKPAKAVRNLALTVGDSFDPLLQLICVLKPQRLVLILNQSYPGGTSGESHGATLRRLIVGLATQESLPVEFRPALSEANVVCEPIDADTPTAVFRSLRKSFSLPQESYQQGEIGSESFTDVVDITGAKKSMVAGAFLYAAHSGLPITYVDFDADAYDQDYHRPYGFLCRIGEIANPYEAYHLRDWERVRQLYERYDFRGARELLHGRPRGDSGILQAMSTPFHATPDAKGLYSPADIDKVMRLSLILEAYELWENGDFRHSHTKVHTDASLVDRSLLPWAVEILGPMWPSGEPHADPNGTAHQLLEEHLTLKQGASTPKDSIFGQPLPLCAYLSDEMGKIRRLQQENEDCRSAYLRAAGLHEFLLKARLALCWLKGGLEAKPTSTTAWGAVSTFGSQEHEAFKYLVEDPSEWKLRKALAPNPPQAYSLKGGNIRRRANAPVMEQYDDGLALDLSDQTIGEGENARPIFVKLRGEAIHTHLSIPRSVALAAIELVEASLDEFKRNWLEVYHPGTVAVMQTAGMDCPNWVTLCRLLELDFLPPRLRA